ncbi:MAG: YjdF family protein [Eubacterium sp.]
MVEVISSITIMFDEPFWIGIYERQFKSKYEVCKITFGAEPKDYEVYEYLPWL